MRGGRGRLLVTNAAGTPQDLTAFVEDVEWGEFATETLDSTVWGLDAKTFESGLSEGGVSASGKYPGTAVGTANNLAATTLRGLRGTPPSRVEWQPEGAGTGRPFRRVEAVLTSFTESAPVGEIVTWAAEWQVSGVETTGTLP